MYTVLSFCVCNRNGADEGDSKICSISGLFPFSVCLCSYTHQTCLALLVLSLSLVLNGHWTLMWLGCCYCFQHVLITVYWSDNRGHENSWSRQTGRKESVPSGAIFNQQHHTPWHAVEFFKNRSKVNGPCLSWFWPDAGNDAKILDTFQNQPSKTASF